MKNKIHTKFRKKNNILAYFYAKVPKLYGDFTQPS